MVYKEAIRIKNKALYRDTRSSLTTLASGTLLIRPKEVIIKHQTGTKKIKAYSMTMAAKALGKSIIQLRVWLSKGYLPKPVLVIKNHNYVVYDVREMQIIRKHLFAYTKTGVSYITKNSLAFIDGLATEIEDYRTYRTAKDAR